MNCLLAPHEEGTVRCVHCGWIYRPLSDVPSANIYRNCPAKQRMLLGDVVAWVLNKLFRVQPCCSCNARKHKLNQLHHTIAAKWSALWRRNNGTDRKS